ncbi:MAG: hypothetical protein R2752_12835 [Vicinamibacterales bacterium]
MTRVAPVFLVVALAVALSACGTATSPDPALPATLTLAPGQESTVGALTLRFTGITSDSRCPGDAICIQAGDVTAAFQATTGKVPATFALQLNDPARSSATVGDYTIHLTIVSPYPFVSLPPIDPEDYRIEVEVRGG